MKNLLPFSHKIEIYFCVDFLSSYLFILFFPCLQAGTLTWPVDPDNLRPIISLHTRSSPLINEICTHPEPLTFHALHRLEVEFGLNTFSFYKYNPGCRILAYKWSPQLRLLYIG